MREYLAQPGRSQAKLAKELGWSQPTVHEIVRERAPRRIKLDEVVEIAAVLGIPFRDLVAPATRVSMDLGKRRSLEIEIRTTEQRVAELETQARSVDRMLRHETARLVKARRHLNDLIEKEG
jgi:DNA-binding Lrp family transcriptional regulator